MGKVRALTRFSPEQRAALLARYETSGLSLRAFAEAEGVSQHTLAHWRRGRGRLPARRAPSAPPPAPVESAPPTFVRVALAPAPPTVAAPVASPPPSPAARYEVVVCPSGHVVRVGADFEPAVLQRLLAALREVAPC